MLHVPALQALKYTILNTSNYAGGGTKQKRERRNGA